MMEVDRTFWAVEVLCLSVCCFFWQFLKKDRRDGERRSVISGKKVGYADACLEEPIEIGVKPFFKKTQKKTKTSKKKLLKCNLRKSLKTSKPPTLFHFSILVTMRRLCRQMARGRGIQACVVLLNPTQSVQIHVLHVICKVK